MSRINTFLLFLFLCFSVSCENKSDSAEELSDNKSYTLRMNFRDNILDLNPFNAKSESEKFVRDIRFENLFEMGNKGPENRVFEQWSYDSVEYVLNIQLSDDIFFQNGSKITTYDIKKAFLSVLKNAESNASIQSFFDAIQGWPMIEWLKLNRNVTDSLPSGMTFINDKNFQIQFVKSDKPIFELMSKIELYLVKKDKDKTYGTGPFQLEVLDSDIFCDLVRSKYYEDYNSNIDHINIRFIKDNQTELQEFQNGALDIIFPMMDNNQINRYSNFSMFNSCKAQISFATWEGDLVQEDVNRLNPHGFDLVMNNAQIISFRNWSQYSYRNSIKSQLVDSINMEYIDSLNLKTTNLVIEERFVNYFQTIDPKQMLLDLSRDIELPIETKLMILAADPNKILANMSLKGLEHHNEISKSVNQLNFVSPSTF